MASMDSPPMTHHVTALREGYTEIKQVVTRVDERVRALELPPPPPPPPSMVLKPPSMPILETQPLTSTNVPSVTAAIPDPFPLSAEYRWGIRIGSYAFIIPWIRLILRREPSTSTNG